MSRENNTVSVVIPTYNRGEFIHAAVASVLAQSYRNLEVIVVDDGSNDATASILDAIDDPRLRYVRQENQGRSHARNVALRLAVGRYIAFLDSDDWYLPNKLALQVDYLEAHADVDMLYTASICVDEAGNPLGHTYEATACGDIYAEVAFFLPVTITLPTVMLRREVLDSVGLFDERMERFEDTDLWRRIAKRHRVGTIAEPTCKVRTHADNTLRNQDPAKIVAAINYYIDKVNREDSDIDPLIRGAGARRLCEYYAAAMLTLESHAPFAELLLNQGRRLFNPKVSIVIPVYNGANYLAEAIQSALAQTYENTEILVINDGSTDGGATEQIARGFGERIRYVSKPNGGVATALNRGIEEMTGDYFSWLSHDDLYVPSKLAVQVGELVQIPDPGRCVLYGDYAVFTGSPEAAVTTALPHVEPKGFRHFITTENVLHGCTLLVPRQAFKEHGGFDPALRTTQDYDLWFRMGTTFRFVHQPIVLVKARSHADQGTVQLSALVLDECNALLTGFVERLSEAEVRHGTTASLAEGYFLLASNLGRRGFPVASARAAELGRENMSSLDPDSLTALMDRGAAAEEIARLSAEVEQLCRQRDAFQAEAKEQRRMLDEVYRSRSWRITAPVRYVSRLVGKIAH